MSHRSTVKTKLTNQKYLLDALTALGYTYTVAQEGQTLKTKGRYNVQVDVDVMVTGTVDGQNYDNSFGFKQQADGTFVADGDFYGLRDHKGNRLDQNSFSVDVEGHASVAEGIERLGLMGFSVDASTVVDNNEYIEVTVTR